MVLKAGNCSTRISHYKRPPLRAGLAFSSCCSLLFLSFNYLNRAAYRVTLLKMHPSSLCFVRNFCLGCYFLFRCYASSLSSLEFKHNIKISFDTEATSSYRVVASGTCSPACVCSTLRGPAHSGMPALPLRIS